MSFMREHLIKEDVVDFLLAPDPIVRQQRIVAAIMEWKSSEESGQHTDLARMQYQALRTAFKSKALDVMDIGQIFDNLQNVNSVQARNRYFAGGRAEFGVHLRRMMLSACGG